MDRGRDLQPGDEALTDYNGPGPLARVRIAERDDTRRLSVLAPIAPAGQQLANPQDHAPEQDEERHQCRRLDHDADRGKQAQDHQGVGEPVHGALVG